MSLTTHSETETVAAGKEFARSLKAGNVVACYGNLGSGKTHFIKGICRGLGVHEHVVSPSFTIQRVYSGNKVCVHHWDFYRIASEADLRELGFEESVAGENICLIEWADRVQDYLPQNRFNVHLGMGDEEQARHIMIEQNAEVAV